VSPPRCRSILAALIAAATSFYRIYSINCDCPVKAATRHSCRRLPSPPLAIVRPFAAKTPLRRCQDAAESPMLPWHSHQKQKGTKRCPRDPRNQRNAHPNPGGGPATPTMTTTTVEQSNVAIDQVDRQRIKQGLGLAVSMNVSSIGHGNRPGG
jgi:hypothetical protein